MQLNIRMPPLYDESHNIFLKYKGPAVAKLFCSQANFQKINSIAGLNKKIGCFFLILNLEDLNLRRFITK